MICRGYWPSHWEAVACHLGCIHDDLIKWKHFPRYWPFVRGIHRSPVNSPHKGQWRGALMFTLICARINGWVNNREAGDLRRYRAHYDVIVMRKTEKVQQENGKHRAIRAAAWMRRDLGSLTICFHNDVIMETFSASRGLCEGNPPIP